MPYPAHASAAAKTPSTAADPPRNEVPYCFGDYAMVAFFLNLKSLGLIFQKLFFRTEFFIPC
jgi:hypothetical protein